MSLSNIQAAIIAAVAQIVALLVSFAVVNSTEAGVIISSSTAVVNAAFLIATALHSAADAIAARPIR